MRKKKKRSPHIFDEEHPVYEFMTPCLPEDEYVSITSYLNHTDKEVMVDEKHFDKINQSIDLFAVRRGIYRGMHIVNRTEFSAIEAGLRTVWS